MNVFGRKKALVATAKRQFLKALNDRDIAAINSLVVDLQSILRAEKLTDLIVNEVMVECDADSHSWFCQIFLGQAQYEQMEGKAQSNVFKILVSKGLEPGKDFSSGRDRSIIIGDRAKQVLLSELHQEHQAAFEAQLESSLVLDPVTTIEQQLGCAFFTNLTEIAIQQMELLSNSQAAAYLGVLLAGLVSRHPQLKDADFPTRFIVNALQGLSQERAMAILNDPETNPQFDEMIIFGHLLAAMGDKEYHRIAEEEGGISLEQLKKLDLVWCGERRLSEIVAMMEKWHFKDR
ncbi:hypothetical protein H6G91_26075 [Nostoc muscorum FACHB-395]|jgi:hypothetical protein|uniref:hypothetical protein n=1 Tax=Nostoc sp. C057 TaxID=2576903 RepID=UPI0015C3B96C|nr:hypothetical protein [Nostoc sp. C057]MBD2510695.1 hypothetical protein [Desmonostoc muscorum FACHB-395]QLE51146.1 hypothetical protein FD724_25740 [Nostoc sp. C057]